jgi:hypothetical protein
MPAVHHHRRRDRQPGVLTGARCALAGLALVALGSRAQAQEVKLGRPSLAPNRESITVSAAGPPYPDAAVISVADRYVVVVRSPAHPAGVQAAIRSVVPEPDLYADTGLIRIVLAAPVAADVTEVDIVSLFGKAARITWSQRKDAGKLGVYPVDKREKADVYLFGSWLTGPDLAPVYNLDLAAGVPLGDFDVRGQPWRFSAKASLKTADRRDADPDAYAVSARVGRVFPVNLGSTGPYLDVQWEVLKAEFSRKDEASNLVSSPVLTLSQRLARSLRPDRSVRAALDLDLQAGLDLGANLQNKLVPDGYGAIVRLVPGVAIYAVFPAALGLDELRWTSTYRARVLLAEEAFIDLRDDDHPFPSVAEGTRHEWKDEFAAKVTPILSLALTHDYGSLPPAFKILDHRVSLGATVMWAWKK